MWSSLCCGNPGNIKQHIEASTSTRAFTEVVKNSSGYADSFWRTETSREVQEMFDQQLNIQAALPVHVHHPLCVQPHTDTQTTPGGTYYVFWQFYKDV